MDIKTVIITEITAFTGTVGFSLLYGLRGKFLLPASLGGLISWSTFLLCDHIFAGTREFLSCFIATMVAAFYVLFLANKMKSPAYCFLLPAAIPLIPGGELYYTFLAFFKDDAEGLKLHASETLTFAFAIAAGMSFVWVFYAMKKSGRDFIRRKK